MPWGVIKYVKLGDGSKLTDGTFDMLRSGIIGALSERWKPAAPIWKRLAKHYSVSLPGGERQLWLVVSLLEDEGIVLRRDVKDADGRHREQVRHA